MHNPIQTVFAAALLLSLAFGIADGSSRIAAASEAKIQLPCGNFALTQAAQDLSTGSQAGLPCGRYGQP
jgi:hypothetical protein